MTTKTVKQESKLEEFTASFLLSEFRKDVRELDNKIDNNFKWILGIAFMMTCTIIGAIFFK